MHLLYSAGLSLVLLLTLPYWLVKMLTTGKYRAGLGERLGRVPERVLRKPAAGCVWAHAVSVGEVLAVGKLVSELQALYPERRVLISTTTAAGQKLARERHGDENVFYFPLDLAFAVRPYLRALRPSLIVLAETEFWPNFLRLAKAEGARIAVVNARISDHSYPRYKRLRFLWRRLLGNVDTFLAQSQRDAQRLIEIGAPEPRVKVSGNLKFDAGVAKDLPLMHTLRRAFEAGGCDPVIVCGSTVAGEEQILIDVFRVILRSHSRAVMVLAPRHPERFDEVAGLLAASDMGFARRTQYGPGRPLAGAVLLLDTIGELASLYALATVAFVGGSLVPRGGHNILEPAQHGVPVLVGPHMENFREIVEAFQRSEALCVVTPESASGAILELLGDPGRRAGISRKVRAIFETESGATGRTLAELEKLLPAAELSPR